MFNKKRITEIEQEAKQDVITINRADFLEKSVDIIEKFKKKFDDDPVIFTILMLFSADLATEIYKKTEEIN